MLEHLADAAGGTGDAAGYARDEPLLLRLGGRLCLCRPGSVLLLILLLGYGISVFHLKVAVAIFRSLALLFISCHFLSRPPVSVEIDIDFGLQNSEGLTLQTPVESLMPRPVARAFWYTANPAATS